MTEQKIEELEPVTPFMMRRPETLPSFDGVIPLQSSSEPARYRVVSCLSRTFNAEQVHELVMHVCRVTCVAIEILRRRQPSRILAKFAEPECIERLEYMRSLLSPTTWRNSQCCTSGTSTRQLSSSGSMGY